MLRLVLIVDPYQAFGSRLQEIAEAADSRVVRCESFDDARKNLSASPPEMLVTSLRLGSFNGIHLAYLARHVNPQVTCVVYDTGHPGLALDVQRAGAFYERRNFIPFALPRYLSAALPAADRRDPSRVDRRTTFRGGRRSTDIALLHLEA